MLAVGQTIGNYVVRSLLGEGGMGMVYLAEHPLIGRRVAIKVIHPEMARNPDTVSRFFTEAQAVNRIGHPNIVDITDFGQTPGGESYFVMEYLPGESLGARLKRGPLAVGDALTVVEQVADALAASHAAGILHRDLKPDNIYIVARAKDAESVKVLDFGLAKLTSTRDQVSHRTRTGSVMGTPYYMAPEQCAGKADIDARADVYSLGVILFEMLAGTVPFVGEGYGEVIVKHMTEPAPRVATLRPECPAWLDELVARLLIKERKERVQTMDELRQTIASCLAGAGLPQPRKAGKPSLLGTQRAAPPRRRRSATPVLLAAGVVAVAAAVGIAYLATRPDVEPVVAAASPDAALAASPPPPAAPDAAAAALPPPPEVKEKIAIHLESDPAGASVELGDGAVIGRTPFDWLVDPSERTVEIRFKKDGYEPRTRVLSLRQPSSVAVDLPRSRSGRPPQPVKNPPPDQPPPPQPTKPPEDDLMDPGK